MANVTIWKRRSELTVVLREALWAYIYMRHTPNPRIEEKTILPLTIILLTPPLKCNVNAITLHLES